MAILSCDDEFADVFEADRGFIKRDLVVIGEGVDEVGGGDAFGDAVAPAAGFDEVVEEQGDDVVGLDEGAVLIDDAEAVGVAVGGDAEVWRRSLSSWLRRRRGDDRRARGHGRRRGHRGSRGRFRR